MSSQIFPSTQMHTPSQKRPFAAAERSQDSMEAKPRPPFARLGFWSAALAAVFSMLFTVGVLVGRILPRPWDVVIPIGASLLLAPSFVVMMVSVHYAAPDEKKIWSHIGITFAVLYAALVSMVYVTWLFVVEPHVLRGQANQVALLIFAQGSFLQMIDGLGYPFMGMATFFAAQVFAGKRLDKWIRWLCLLYGLGAVLFFLSYVFYIIPLGAGWFIFPPLAILLAVYFRRAGNTAR